MGHHRCDLCSTLRLFYFESKKVVHSRSILVFNTLDAMEPETSLHKLTPDITSLTDFLLSPNRTVACNSLHPLSTSLPQYILHAADQ